MYNNNGRNHGIYIRWSIRTRCASQALKKTDSFLANNFIFTTAVDLYKCPKTA